ncbi:MAG: uL30 family ribosomal protein [Candidatus Nanoarchaeia archaeon]
MIIVLRISGRVGQAKAIEETLNRLGLKRKFSFILVDEKDSIKMGMIKKVREHVSYGEVDEKLAEKLKGKKGLHPPRGGFKKSTKLEYPKGILGKNKDINKLIERML